jgi:hypothetical protein
MSRDPTTEHPSANDPRRDVRNLHPRDTFYLTLAWKRIPWRANTGPRWKGEVFCSDGGIVTDVSFLWRSGGSTSQTR